MGHNPICMSDVLIRGHRDTAILGDCHVMAESEMGVMSYKPKNTKD